MFTHRADRSRRRSSAAASARPTSCTTGCSRTARAAASSREAPPQLDDVQRRILADVESRATPLASFARPRSATQAHWAELEAKRTGSSPRPRRSSPRGGEHVRAAPGKEFVVRLHSYDVELGLDDPWFRRARRTGCSTSRTRTSACGRSSSTSTSGTRSRSRRRRAQVVAALAPRLQRPAPAEGFSLPRRRRRGHGAVRVRCRQRARRAVRGRLGLAAARRELPDRRTSSRSASRPSAIQLHGAEGHAHLLQHGRLPPRRLRDDEAARARDRDVLLAGFARFADRAELSTSGRADGLDPAQRFALS